MKQRTGIWAVTLLGLLFHFSSCAESFREIRGSEYSGTAFSAGMGNQAVGTTQSTTSPRVVERGNAVNEGLRAGTLNEGIESVVSHAVTPEIVPSPLQEAHILPPKVETSAPYNKAAPLAVSTPQGFANKQLLHKISSLKHHKKSESRKHVTSGWGIRKLLKPYSFFNKSKIRDTSGKTSTRSVWPDSNWDFGNWLIFIVGLLLILTGLFFLILGIYLGAYVIFWSLVFFLLPGVLFLTLFQDWYEDWPILILILTLIILGLLIIWWWLIFSLV
jgi:hypothetical protein